MKQWYKVIDVALCHDCNNCFMADKDEFVGNDWPGYTAAQPRHDHRWVDILRRERGTYARNDVAYLPLPCQHCQNAPCESVCPAGATYRHSSGVVLINEKMCVGCKYCAVACTYDARVYDEGTGVVDKCWLCLDWVLGGGKPACVQACVTGARIFGRRDDAEIAELLASGRPQRLHPEFGTEPGIVYYIFPGS